jgi:hypothetical protein
VSCFSRLDRARIRGCSHRSTALGSHTPALRCCMHRRSLQRTYFHPPSIHYSDQSVLHSPYYPRMYYSRSYSGMGHDIWLKDDAHKIGNENTVANRCYHWTIQFDACKHAHENDRQKTGKHEAWHTHTHTHTHTQHKCGTGEYRHGKTFSRRSNNGGVPLSSIIRFSGCSLPLLHPSYVSPLHPSWCDNLSYHSTTS